MQFNIPALTEATPDEVYDQWPLSVKVGRIGAYVVTALSRALHFVRDIL